MSRILTVVGARPRKFGPIERKDGIVRSQRIRALKDSEARERNRVELERFEPRV